jgi:hypothetical protein
MKAKRPLSPEQLKQYIKTVAFSRYSNRTASDKQRGLMAGMLKECLSGDRKGRYAVCEWLTGEASSYDIPDSVILAMIDWLGPEKEGASWSPCDYAIKEAQKVLIQALKDQGQMELF